jgi:hypothetical protein
LAIDDTTLVLGRFIYLLCHIVSSKNQTGQTGMMETGRKELIVIYRIIILSDQYCWLLSAAIPRCVWVDAELDEFLYDKRDDRKLQNVLILQNNDPVDLNNLKD